MTNILSNWVILVFVVLYNIRSSTSQRQAADWSGELLAQLSLSYPYPQQLKIDKRNDNHLLILISEQILLWDDKSLARKYQIIINGKLIPLTDFDQMDENTLLITPHHTALGGEFDLNKGCILSFKRKTLMTTGHIGYCQKFDRNFQNTYLPYVYEMETFTNRTYVRVFQDDSYHILEISQNRKPEILRTVFSHGLLSRITFFDNDLIISSLTRLYRSAFFKLSENQFNGNWSLVENLAWKFYTETKLGYSAVMLSEEIMALMPERNTPSNMIALRNFSTGNKLYDAVLCYNAIYCTLTLDGRLLTHESTIYIAQPCVNESVLSLYRLNLSSSGTQPDIIAHPTQPSRDDNSKTSSMENFTTSHANTSDSRTTPTFSTAQIAILSTAPTAGVLLIIGAVIAFYCWCRRKRENKPNYAAEPANSSINRLDETADRSINRLDETPERPINTFENTQYENDSDGDYESISDDGYERIRDSVYCIYVKQSKNLETSQTEPYHVYPLSVTLSNIQTVDEETSTQL